MIKKYIEFKNIGKTYSDSFTAVSDFNLSINKGEFVTLLGPSGCGKTTILKMIGGFETISEGTISINGYIINDLPPNKRVTSTVFQDYALFPNLTVYKNIMFGLKSFRVDLPKEEIKQDVKRLERYKRIWHKTATKKISDIERDLAISRENLAKALNKYNQHPEWVAIKTMREENYQKKVLRLETLKRAMKKNGDVLLDKKITNASTRFDKEFVSLRKWYKSKRSIDKEVDFLKNTVSEQVDWLSYWHNYTVLQTEDFEKKYTTRSLSKKEIKKRVSDIIEKVGLVGKENKRPADLSGGMQQRVALARSIVIEPEIILLDEPLSALDAQVRHQMQVELKRLHQELGLTFILVTHDQEEALSLSTKIVVMRNGKIQQVGTPGEIYDTPNTEWVSSFIGNANYFEAHRNSKGIFTFNGMKVVCDNPIIAKSAAKESLFIIRPEDMKIVKYHTGFIDAKIKSVIYKGLKYDITCSWEGHELQIESTHNYAVGKYIGIKWAKNDVHFIQRSKEE